MNRILRWLLRGFLVLAGLAGVAVAILWTLLMGSLPEYDGEVVVEGLDAPVEVLRDANAVPHIRSETAHDMWFALGMVHAQDRLWQMEVARRSAQGRLSALFGPRTLGLDRLVRRLDLYGHARRAVAHQTPEARAALEAYAAGVNAWIRHVDANSLGRGAPEFFLFGRGFEPWTAADSLGILKSMALRLTAAARHEIRRARFQLALPPERVADILPDDPTPAELTAPWREALFPGALFPAARFAETEAGPAPAPDPLLEALGPATDPRLAGASNAWAVDGTRSSSRAPLLANDPHLWLSAPSVWYLADVAGGGLRGIGGTLPGVPAILSGHNGRLGWGLTTANVDDQDLFIERLNPDNPAQYLTPEGWRDFEARRIRIEIAGEAPLVETVLATRHGPVLDDDMLGVDAVTPEGHVAALAWTALKDEDRGYSALLELLRGTRVADGLAAAEGVSVPAQAVVLADGEEIGLVLAGEVPLRPEQSAVRGRLPAPGWTGEHDWLGRLAPERLPRIVAPAEGALATANARLTDAPYPEHLSHDWDAPYRIRRILKELSGRRFHSRDSFVALQSDSVSGMARAVLPLIARDLWWRDGTGPVPEPRRIALERLADWTGEMDQHSPEPLIFAEWMRQLTRRLAADELGALIDEVAGPQPLFVERVFRDIDGADIWCDIDKTPERETCPEIAASALDAALARLAAEQGADIAGWRWGSVHRAVHRHMPLGFAGPLGLLVNIEQETSGGDYTIMRGATPGRGRRPFENAHASGLRIVIDFADLDRSSMMISTGQSGHPLSRWYDHLAEPWARGDMIPMSTSETDAVSGGVGVMRLIPAGPG